MKEIIGKLDFIKIKIFCSVKDTIQRMKKQATDREKHLQTHLIKIYPKYTKNYNIKLNNKKTKNPM